MRFGARAGLELFVVSDNVFGGDTVSMAPIRLPAAGWGEKDGTVTNSERRISRQRAFLPSPGEAQPDWWIVSEVARRMGYADAFPYRSAAEVFAEHAALSAFENDGSRAFDIGGLAALGEMRTTCCRRSSGHCQPVATRPNGACSPKVASSLRISAPASSPWGHAPAADDERFPLRLNTGRIRDQWHTMTRTGKSPRLAHHTAEPYIEVHPDDARRHGLDDGGLAEVSTRHGHASCASASPRDSSRAVSSRPSTGAPRTPAMVGSAPSCTRSTDAISGQPDSKATAACIAPARFRYRGFIVSHSLLSLDCAYWVRVPERGGWLYLVAMDGPAGAAWSEWFLGLTGTPEGDFLELSDRHSDSYRAASVHDGRLHAAIIITAGDDLPPSTWLAGLLGDIAIDRDTRRALLAARMPEPAYDQGPIVCACFGVGLNRIGDAIAQQKLSSVEAIGQALKAGTNCGSCTPELRRMLDHPPHHG